MTTNYAPEPDQTTTSNSANPRWENYSHWTDNSLLLAYDYWHHQQALTAAVLGHMEQAILQRMRERGAKAIPSEEFICELATRDTYDQVSFGPLKEVLNEADLRKALTPAHEETVQVEDKWHTTTVKALAVRYGAAALAIVERARIPGAPRLKFERRK